MRQMYKVMYKVGNCYSSQSKEATYLFEASCKLRISGAPTAPSSNSVNTSVCRDVNQVDLRSGDMVLREGVYFFAGHVCCLCFRATRQVQFVSCEGQPSAVQNWKQNVLIPAAIAAELRFKCEMHPVLLGNTLTAVLLL